MDKASGALSDDEIIAFLQSADDLLRKRALHHLFTNKSLRNKVYKYVLDHKRDAELAKEVFQYALEVFEKKARTGAFEQKSAVHTYFLGIVKWHLLNEDRKQGRLSEYDPEVHAEDEQIQAVEDEIVDEERHKTLREIIAQLGERCKKLLPRWAQDASPEQLCKEFGFSTPDMAKKETYRCRQKLKEFVDKRPWLKDQLNK